MLSTNLWTPSFVQENEEWCLEFLDEKNNFHQVPSLNHLTAETTEAEYRRLNGKMVSFRGMIQDHLDPVVYLAEYSVRDKNSQVISTRNSKYHSSSEIMLKESEEFMGDIHQQILADKSVVHCVHIPGLNQFAYETYITNFDSMHNTPTKRMKTSYSTDSIGCMTSIKPGYLLHIYDDKIKIRLNDVIEIAGFLSVPSNLNVDENEINNQYGSLMEIHVVFAKLSPTVFTNVPSIFKEEIFTNIKTLRDEIWLMCTNLMLGDTLAADYFICHLISAVYSRGSGLAIGKFTLNVSLPTDFENENYVQSLYKFLEHVVEKSIYYSFTIENLNAATLIPGKSIEGNRLLSTLLQLSDRTHFVIDETKISAGQLNNTGVLNLKALSEIISNQTVHYDFEIYKLPFESNIMFLTFSRGKSMLPNDVTLKLNTNNSHVNEQNEMFTKMWTKLEEPFLSKLRFYINHVSRLAYTIDPDIQKVVTNEMVSMRKNNSETDLHRTMNLSRLLTLSYGETFLTNEFWKRSCEMESQRKARL